MGKLIIATYEIQVQPMISPIIVKNNTTFESLNSATMKFFPKTSNLTKKLWLIIGAIIISTFLHAQNEQEIKVLRYKDGSVLIESKIKEISPLNFNGKVEKVGIWQNNGEYWLGKQTTIILQNSLKKAISWAEINKTQRKDFEKEITRIRVTNKTTYEFYRRYISEFSKECVIIFTGFEDGTFKLTLTVTEDVKTLTFNTKEEIKDFIEILNGKSVNKEIDDIFK